MVKFYSIKKRQAVEVPISSVSKRMTSNNRKQITATVDGEKLYKFVSSFPTGTKNISVKIKKTTVKKVKKLKMETPKKTTEKSQFLGLLS